MYFQDLDYKKMKSSGYTNTTAKNGQLRATIDPFPIDWTN